MGYERPQSLDEQSVAVPASPLDYYAVLSSVVEQTKHQPAQLRAMIYELARVNLKREAVMRYPQLSRAEFTQHMYELERAIERFEADASGHYDNMVFRPHALLGGQRSPRSMTRSGSRSIRPATMRRSATAPNNRGPASRTRCNWSARRSSRLQSMP
jgi:hypothetical protein